ncbi:NADH-ubiquinone oxidoreductase chain 4 [Platanthera zijinensis]|uniref:NADH-ubiquinone oxidoreductase chain 4 n=1 Tax=Platanthera zijinensis TaxID=2320716 RepID=A0AAP0B2Y6_9ASPA
MRSFGKDYIIASLIREFLMIVVSRMLDPLLFYVLPKSVTIPILCGAEHLLFAGIKLFPLQGPCAVNPLRAVLRRRQVVKSKVFPAKLSGKGLSFIAVGCKEFSDMTLSNILYQIAAVLSFIAVGCKEFSDMTLSNILYQIAAAVAFLYIEIYICKICFCLCDICSPNSRSKKKTKLNLNIRAVAAAPI